MKLTDQVIPLDLAKRLKALGVKQESYFSWVEVNGTVELRDATKHELVASFYKQAVHTYETVYAAFTVAELGELLPPFYRSMDVGRLNGTKSWWEVKEWQEKDIKKEFYSENEAEARGLMLAYLLENNLLAV